MKFSSGLYFIADFSFPAMRSAEQAVTLIQPGLALVQYRDKSADAAQRLRRASRLKVLCDKHEVPLIINDDAGLAAEIDAAGVHLGADDSSVTQARRLLGDDKIIGASCYQSLNRAVEQHNQSADYVAFGAVFPSATKPQAKVFDLNQLPSCRKAIRIPICVIGGIRIRHIKQMVNAGADLVAIAGDILNAADPGKQIRRGLDELSNV